MIVVKHVIHDPITNSVEAQWVDRTVEPDRVIPGYTIPEHTEPARHAPDGQEIEPERITPEQVVPERVEPGEVRDVSVKCQSYDAAQMDLLEADLGADAPDYADLIATVRASVNPPSADYIAQLKLYKNLQINLWRAQANQSTFTHAGKQIACDPLSRSDIDAVATAIALNGAFPESFPGAWKAVDNSYIPLPTAAAFKDFYASMTYAGTVNFARAQELKSLLHTASTVDEINALEW